MLRGLPAAMPYRLGPRKFIEAGGCFVRISEDARRCAVFLGYADPSDPQALSRIEGTGFFVAHERHAYLVTAGHVARTLSGAPFAIRLTGADDLGHVLEVERPIWHTHTDQSVDIAVMLIDAPDWGRTTAVPSRLFADERRIRYWDIGPGDAAYVVGLFHLHPGKRRNLPVVHSGHIALMPSDEKIPVRKRGGQGVEEVEAYLVEAHTLPGASGSQVMIRPTIWFTPEVESFKTPDDEGKVAAIAEARDYLLGVWIAAWPGNPDDEMRKALGITNRTWIPVGMGLVVPSERIMDILTRDDLAKKRREIEQQAREARAATPTGFAPEPMPSENPDHREDFNRLVSAASQSKPKGDRT